MHFEQRKDEPDFSLRNFLCAHAHFSK